MDRDRVVRLAVALGPELAPGIEDSPREPDLFMEKALAGRANHAPAFTRRDYHERWAGALNEIGGTVDLVFRNEQALPIALNMNGRKAGLSGFAWGGH